MSAVRSCEPIRIGKSHWRAIALYPPVLLSVAVAWTAAIAFEWWRPFDPAPGTPSLVAWFPNVIVATLLAGVVVMRQWHWRSSDSDGPAITSFDAKSVQNWAACERPQREGEPDLFKHDAIVQKVGAALAIPGYSVALLGRFGSGKSSILNRVLQQLATAEPTGYAQKMLGIQEGHDATSELGRLERLLVAIDSRVVLVIEDVDRAGDTFDTRHLQRLLWALRSLERVAFVIAANVDHRLDLGKLCDFRERIADLGGDEVAVVLAAAYQRWRIDLSAGDLPATPPSAERDRLGLEKVGANPQGAERFARGWFDQPADALAVLLKTPRDLKHLVRRVEQVWGRLHGEVDLEELIILSAIALKAPTVMDFLARNIGEARLQPHDMRPRSKRVKPAWDSLLADLDDASAVKHLIGVLGIAQLMESSVIARRGSLQSVASEGPTDYFRRIESGQLGDGDVSDQSVLRDLYQWENSEGDALRIKLSSASGKTDAYGLRWEHFAPLHSDERLMLLTQAVIAGVMERESADATMESAALIPIWRASHPRFARDTHAAWLEDLILSPLPGSAWV